MIYFSFFFSLGEKKNYSNLIQTCISYSNFPVFLNRRQLLFKKIIVILNESDNKVRRLTGMNFGKKNPTNQPNKKKQDTIFI